MIPDRFRRLAVTYGADFERWPRTERAAGRACAVGTPEARRALDDARAFDMVLDRAALPPGDDAVDRVVGAVGHRLDALAEGAAVVGRCGVVRGGSCAGGRNGQSPDCSPP